jgi:hypothetical protein
LTGQKEVHLQNVHGIKSELLELLNGMDYCLDWKPELASWSARQVVYHLLDTPPGGVPRLLSGMFSGDLPEIELWSDEDYVTPQRQTYDLEQIREDIDEFFQGMQEALEAAREEDFQANSVLVRQRVRGWDEPRSAQDLLEGLFARHWREHLTQIGRLRDALGI